MAEGGADFGKGFMIVAASAGAGALATVAGYYLVDKVRDAFARRPKMKLFHKHPFLSARCTWFISELGAEEDFSLRGVGMSESFSSRSQRSISYENVNEDKATFTQSANMTSLTRKFESMDSVYSDTDSLTEYKQGPPDCLPTFIVNDEFTMIEGTAMCMYLADLYQEFLPHPDNKAEYYSWMVYSASTFDNIMKTLQHQLVDLPDDSKSDVMVEPALNGFHAFARALSQTLEDKTYLCGERFTAVDCVIGFTLWWAFTFEGGNLLEGYPVLLNYLQRLKGRPAFQKIFGRDDSFDWKSCINTGFNALGHTDDLDNDLDKNITK